MFFIIVLFIIFIFYYYSTSNLNYWNNKHIKYVKPRPFFIEVFQNLFRFNVSPEKSMEVCRLHPDEKMIAYYVGVKPVLVVKDPLYLKYMGVLDFEHFSGREIMFDNKDPMYKNLFYGDGDIWRLLRKSLTSVFTISKLKRMFPLMLKCADKLQILGDKIVERGGIVSGKEMMSRYSIDFIASCGMGLEFGAIDESNTQLFDFTTDMFNISKIQTIMHVLLSSFPFINNFYPWHLLRKKKIKKFVDIIVEVCKKRNFKPSGRPDFVDLLLEIAQLGKITGESIDKKNPDGSPAVVELDFTDPILIATQVYVFFSAGFGTSSSLMGNTLHELAKQPDLQRRVQNEIDEVLAKYDNKLCYDAICEMTLLEMVFLETTRMFPPCVILSRVCTKKYTFPGTSTTIDPGVHIVVPVAAIHMDERYFENPHKFLPERFSPGYKERIGHVFFPFGIGKRMCIASNLGQMETVIGVAAVLQRFTIELAPSLQNHFKAERNIVHLTKADGGLPIKLIPRILQ